MTTQYPQYRQADDPSEVRPRQNKKNEIVRLQSEITNEIERDAPHIARMVFGDTKDMPDMVGLPNEQIDQVYRQKFLAEDRVWLQGEARRDPEQFLKVAERIGVVIPPPTPGMAQMPQPGAFAKAATSAAPSLAVPPSMAPSMPPVAPIAPVPPVLPLPAPAASPAPAAVPVVLGPNGQPLPPSGLV